jgi:hypothetical protein
LLESDGKIRNLKRSIRRVVWLFCVVTLAVVAGNLISAAIIAQLTDDSAIARVEAALIAEQKRKQLDASKDFFAEEARKESDRLAKAIEAHERLMARTQDKSDKQAVLDKQLSALCDFWIAQYKKDKQASTKIQRDSACTEAGRSAD